MQKKKTSNIKKRISVDRRGTEVGAQKRSEDGGQHKKKPQKRNKQTKQNNQKRNDATCINLATQSPHSVSFLRRRRVRVDDTKENGKNRKRDKKNEE